MAYFLHNMSAVEKDYKSWFCYLPQSPGAREWGFFVLDAGYTLIPPNTPYPPGKHPDDHMFSWEKGRTLDSFTLVYITRGSGVFESRSGGQQSINAGDLFIVYPGEWHRYRPDPATGWDEYWVEFDGEQARRIMRNQSLAPVKPVHTIGIDNQILRLFLEISEAAQIQTPGFEQIIAAQAALIVARIRAHRFDSNPEARQIERVVQHARVHILKNADQCINFQRLASELGVSYSALRHNFKQITGLSPGQYKMQIQINKACALLRNSDLTVAQIAEQLGFESIYYFSRLFKNKTGLSPLAYRKG
ncbi:MAG: AraC family transcriptional regulator [Kiritimatiellae bacterium]|nr:AraC family transcriptional regulator [Kiritimatiellia bacterium]